MKTTTNLGLKKPETNEYVSVSDLNYNADAIDEAISSKINALNGDISGTVIKVLDDIEERYPVPVAGENAKRFLGKVKKFMNDFNKSLGVTEVTLTASKWSGNAAPYSQTVTLSGVTNDSEAMVVSALEDGVSEAVQKAYTKAFGIVVSGTASFGDGTATFKVYKKPETDIKIGLKGV